MNRSMFLNRYRKEKTKANISAYKETIKENQKGERSFKLTSMQDTSPKINFVGKS